MKPIYCADSQDRIPVEYFKQGKAIWSGGRPYLTENAVRLGLRPDARPPAEYAEALGFAPAKPVEAPKPPIAAPARPAQAVVPPAAPVKPVEAPKPPIAAPARPVQAVVPPAAPVKPIEAPKPAPVNVPRVVAKPPPPIEPAFLATRKESEDQVPSTLVPPGHAEKAAAPVPSAPPLPQPPPLPVVPKKPEAPKPAEPRGDVVQKAPAKLVVPGKNRDEAFIQHVDAPPAVEPKPVVAPPSAEAAKPADPVAEAQKPATPVAEAPKPVEPKPAAPAGPGGTPRRAVAWIKPGDAVDTSSDDQETMCVPGLKVPRIGLQMPPAAAQTPGEKPAHDAPPAARPGDAAGDVIDNQETVNIPGARLARTGPPLPPAAAQASSPKSPHDALREAAAKLAAAASAKAASAPLPETHPERPPTQPTPPVVAKKAVIVEATPPALERTVLFSDAELLLPGIANVPAAPAAVPSAKAPPPADAHPHRIDAHPHPADAHHHHRHPADAQPHEAHDAAKAPGVPAAKGPPAAKAAPVAPVKPAAAAKAAPDDDEMGIAIPLQPGEPLTVDEMKRLEILEGIPEAIIKRLYGGIVRREFKRGDLICRQGEYASTAFYIQSGSVEVYIVTPDKAALAPLKKKSRGDAGGLIGRLRSWVQGRKEGSRKSKSGRPDIQNVPDLPPDLRRAEIGPGELFGEMSCINFYPRSANVRAKVDCVVIEIIRTVLDAVRTRKSKYKEKLDRNYRERALAEHLNSIPLFKDLDPEFIDQLRRRVELQDFEPGEVIFKQGDASDAFYLVRRGCVKISQTQPGGELVLTYLGQNDSFGEIGVLRNVKRTATCTALDHVEVVKIEKKHFDFLIHCYDEFKMRMDRTSDERLATARDVSSRPPPRPMDEFIGQELMQAQNILLLDLEKCTRCDECVKACVDSHDDGKTRLMREGLRFDKYLLATSCRSCMDPVCMIGCPVGSIRREATFEIIIEDWCIGCEKCAKQCPYGNITMHEFPLSKEEQAREEDALRKKAAAAAAKPPAAPGKKPVPEAAPEKKEAMKVAAVKKLAVTCDQCSTLQDPSCVYACPHEAAMRVNARDFFEIVGKSTLKEAAKSGKRA